MSAENTSIDLETVSDAKLDVEDDALASGASGALLESLDVAEVALGDLTEDAERVERSMGEAESANEAARPAGLGCQS